MKNFFENIIVCHLDRSEAEWRDLSSEKSSPLGKGVEFLEISHRTNYYSKRDRTGCGFEMTNNHSCHLDRSEAKRRDPLTTFDNLNLNDKKKS